MIKKFRKNALESTGERKLTKLSEGQNIRRRIDGQATNIG
jgi:hypothetical protein